MTQLRIFNTEYATYRKKLMAEMKQFVPRNALLKLIEPIYPKTGNTRLPRLLKTTSHIHFLQNRPGYSDPTTKKVLYEMTPLRRSRGSTYAEREYISKCSKKWHTTTEQYAPYQELPKYEPPFAAREVCP